MRPEAIRVSDLLLLAKKAIEAGTGPVWVVGEISSFKRHLPSGHLYFDLKDGNARISCVSWKETARRMRFDPQDGLLVRAHGTLGIYEVQGRLQFYVDGMEPAGIGELQAAFEALKRRLADEGLFDEARKVPLPRYPHRIGLATSPAGAAIRDVLRVLKERWPLAEVIFHPCAVQGAEAADEIVRSLERLDAEPGIDLVLLVRGGGSIEDLWSFNEEAVVRAIAAMDRPVVTGIGHEIDFTLADFAADLRAATPSQAAELAVPSSRDLREWIHGRGARLRQRARARLSEARLHLSRLEGSHGMRRTAEVFRRRRQRIDELHIRIANAVSGKMEARRRLVAGLDLRFRARDPRRLLARTRERLGEIRRRGARAITLALRTRRERLAARGAHLEAVGPQSVLSRGYAICLRERDGRAVRRFDEVQAGDAVRVLLSVGALGCRVEERREERG